jgi:hypothetical protein
VALVTARVRPEVLPRLRGWWGRHGDLLGAAAAVGVGVVLLISGVLGLR